MSERAAFPIEIGKMGAVWVASLTMVGVSSIGATREDALAGVVKALQSHAATGQMPGPASVETDCEACS